MRLTPYAAVVLTVLAAVSCAKQPGLQSTTPGAGTSPNPAEYAGTGHMSLAGSMILTHDFAVKGCWVSAPGSSVLSGYSVTFARDSAIESGGILVKQYDRDGTYSIDTHEQYAALAVFLVDGQKPGSVVLTDAPGSALNVTIADGGRSGSAQFSRWNGGKDHPGEISGTIDWECGAVRRT